MSCHLQKNVYKCEMIARFKNNLRNKNKTFKKCDVKIKKIIF